MTARRGRQASQKTALAGPLKILVAAVLAGTTLVVPTTPAGARATSASASCNDKADCYRHTNGRPIAGDDTYSSPKDVTTVVYAGPGVLGNDTDPDSDPLSAALVANPAHGTLVLKRDGSFTYKPAAGYEGPDRFTYQASDRTDTSPVATVNLKIGSFDEAPVAKPDDYRRDLLSTLSVPAPGVMANDDGGGTLGAHTVSGPAHGTLALEPDGSFTYQPLLLGLPNPSGTDTFTYRLFDGDRFGMATTVTITIRLPLGVGTRPPATNS